MDTNGTRALVALAAVAFVVVAFFVLKGDEEAGEGSSVNANPTTTTPTTTEAGGGDSTREEPATKQEPAATEVTTIVLEDGVPAGGVAELEFDKGDMVEFAVEADDDDEIHVHGYDLYEDLPAGRTVDVAFPADLDGIYEIESHSTGQLLAELRVNP